MQKILSTDDFPAKDRFRRWRDMCDDRLTPLERTPFGEAPFHASLSGGAVGGLTFSQLSFSNLGVAATRDTIRRPGHKADQLWASFMLSGSASVNHNGHSCTDRGGSLSIRDPNTPLNIVYTGETELFTVELPRQRLEESLGPARNYAGLISEAHLTTSALTLSFLRRLIGTEGTLSPDAAKRLASVAVDLVVASIAERMATATPRSLHGTVTVQRAKACIEANLSNPDLDAAYVASSVGVSLRQLQHLFQQHQRQVCGWIWQRRLEMAARLLTDTNHSVTSIGRLAHLCGFVSQAHFTRRFRDQHGLSPQQFRDRAFLEGRGPSSAADPSCYPDAEEQPDHARPGIATIVGRQGEA